MTLRGHQGDANATFEYPSSDRAAYNRRRWCLGNVLRYPGFTGYGDVRTSIMRSNQARVGLGLSAVVKPEG